MIRLGQNTVSRVAFTPKGGCPLKLLGRAGKSERPPLVAFTPKGGCPLKRWRGSVNHSPHSSKRCNIHPQGWVPIETAESQGHPSPFLQYVAFTPKGGCLLKPYCQRRLAASCGAVAFTPKGGCPLKPRHNWGFLPSALAGSGSIHPQGWVPIETPLDALAHDQHQHL